MLSFKSYLANELCRCIVCVNQCPVMEISILLCLKSQAGSQAQSSTGAIIVKCSFDCKKTSTERIVCSSAGANILLR